MPFITQGKTNWILIMVVVIVAALTVCGILIYIENYNNDLYFLNQFIDIKNIEKNQGEFADWNIYRDENLAFEIKYPKDWIFSGKRSSVTNNISREDVSFKHKEIIGSYYFSVSVFENPQGFNLKEWWEKIFIEKLSYPSDYSHEGSLIIAGTNSELYKSFDTGGLYKYYLIPKNSKIYVIETLLDKEKINPILSTFRFIEPINTTDWNTYKNTDLGFQINYPSDWDNFLTPDFMILAPAEHIKEVRENAKTGDIGMGPGHVSMISFVPEKLNTEEIKNSVTTSSEMKITTQKVLIDNIEAIRYQKEYITKDEPWEFYNAGDILVSYSIPTDKGYLNIQLLDSEYFDTFEKIVSTFKFIQ